MFGKDLSRIDRTESDVITMSATIDVEDLTVEQKRRLLTLADSLERTFMDAVEAERR
jgi:hypothetical protein